MKHDIQAVAVLGRHKGYQLKQADLTCSSLDELSVINIRRLFANRGNEFMDLSTQKATKGLPNSRLRLINNAVSDR